MTACEADTACLACVASYNDDDSTCDGDALTCSDVVDSFCCAYGDSCNDNALLVAYVGKQWAPVSRFYVHSSRVWGLLNVSVGNSVVVDAVSFILIACC